MSPLRQALADYLQIRRALGYKLERAEKLLAQYLDYLDALGVERITTENAVAWATLPAVGKDGHWWAFRLSVVRGFSKYLHALDDRHEVPPADVLPNRVHRATPYPVFAAGDPRVDGRHQPAARRAAPGDLPDADRAAVGHRHARRGGDPPGSLRPRPAPRDRDGARHEVRQVARAADPRLDRRCAPGVPAVA